MTVLMPRIDREQSRALIEQASALSIPEIAERMPERSVVTTSSELGGLEADEDQLSRVRSDVLALARTHGYPNTLTSVASFEGRCAELLHAELAISPHEASSEGVWSYLTICWLMDVAVWRWSGTGGERRVQGDLRRFHGDVNRNTFRRLWWRREIFGPGLDLSQLGQDEFVSIMERPTITANRRLVRILTVQFLDRAEREPQSERMILMREACKHILRLTPVVDLYALNVRDLEALVDAILDAAATATPLVIPAGQDSGEAVAHSASVEQVTELATADVAGASIGSGSELPADVAELAQVAIGLARRAGRVTNASLREVVPIDPLTARQLLQGLVDRGDLSRRGTARGTFYVVAEPVSAKASALDPREDGDASTQAHGRDGMPSIGEWRRSEVEVAATDGSAGPDRDQTAAREAAVASTARPAREALRRLLRRS